MTETLTPTGLAPTSVAIARQVVSYAFPFIVVAGLWQLASLFFPPFLFPSLVSVFWRCLEIVGTWSQFADVLATVLRILAGLTGAFLIGCVLAIMMVRSRRVDGFIAPLLTLFQGIPALSWVVFATGGVGYELLQQQQQFDMAGALAWTLQLVFFVLIAQAVLSLIESLAFRYRAMSERSL